jgi:hypothetical protein
MVTGWDKFKLPLIPWPVVDRGVEKVIGLQGGYPEAILVVNHKVGDGLKVFRKDPSMAMKAMKAALKGIAKEASLLAIANDNKAALFADGDTCPSVSRDSSAF